MKRMVLASLLLLMLLGMIASTQAVEPKCTTNCGGGGRMCKMVWTQSLGCYVKYCCFLREGKIGCEWWPVGIYC